MLSQYLNTPSLDVPLIRINIKHWYYADQSPGKLWDYVIAPSTADFFRNAGLEPQFTPEGINIWVNSDKVASFIYFLENEVEMSLSFFMYPRQSSWLAISEIPYPPDVFSGLLYFTNGSQKGTYLSIEPTVGEEDLYSKKTLSLPYTPSQNQKNAGEQPQGLIKIEKNVQVNPGASSSPSPLMDTLEKLVPKGKEKPIGWIHLSWNSAMRKQCLDDLQQRHQVRTFLYELSFQPRKIYWRYWLILKNKKDRDRIHQLKIVSDLEEITFLGPEEYEVGRNAWAYCFISQDKLPFLERSPFRFSVIITHRIPEELDYEGKKYHTMAQPLPLAAPEHVHWVKLQEGLILCAEIKMYL